MCTWIYIYIHIYMYMYMYMFVLQERERVLVDRLIHRETERERKKETVTDR